MILAASLAISIGSCPGIWSHTSTDPSRDDFKMEVTESGLTLRFNGGDGLNGPLDPDATIATYITDAGPVEVSDCGPQTARMTFEAKSYDLVRLSNETGPSTWCESGIHGFFGLAAGFQRLTNYGSSRSEFETDAEFRTRRAAARQSALSQNRFLPVVMKVHVDSYDADRRGFQFTAIELDEGTTNAHFVRLSDGRNFLIPVNIDRARQIRATAGSNLTAFVFMVIEVDQSVPVTMSSDPAGRSLYRTINASDIVCLSAEFPPEIELD